MSSDPMRWNYTAFCLQDDPTDRMKPAPTREEVKAFANSLDLLSHPMPLDCTTFCPQEDIHDWNKYAAEIHETVNSTNQQ